MARSAEPCELSASIVVARPVRECWNLYINNALVPDWAPAVTGIECSQASLAANVIRKNHVIIDGKVGHTVEQCILFDSLKRIEFNIIEETFGFAHMLNSYGFALSFDVENQQTLLVMHTHYVPKKIFSSIMNAKPTQQKIIDLMSQMLQGFKSYAQNQ